jgi:hypothetical protein
MNKRIILAQAVIYATFLTACGDGGNSGEPLIPNELQVGGIWTGEATTDIFQPGSAETIVEKTVFKIFTTEPDPETGMSQFRLVGEFAWQAKGEISVTEGADSQENDKLEGSFTAFAPDGNIFSSGAATAACTIDVGKFKEEITGDEFTKWISGTYTCTNKNDVDDPNRIVAAGSFLADYDEMLYEQPSSINRIAGTWCGIENATTTPIVVLTLTVLEDGDALIVDGKNVIGSNKDNCDYRGIIDIIDPVFNLYEIELGLSSCQVLDGTYTGLATLIPGEDESKDEFIYQVDNGSTIVTQIVLKNGCIPL